MRAYENLLDASFKGVPFCVESEELTRFGRRIANHEYPNTSEQFSEDTGGFPRDFNVSGFLVGDDVSDQLDALINACNEEGKGRLVLPFFGSMDVVCSEGNVSVEPYVDAGRVHFTLAFHISRDEAGFVNGSFDSMSIPGLCDWSIDGLSDKFGARFNIADDIFGKAIKTFDLNALLKTAQNLCKFIPSGEAGGILRTIANIAGDLPRLITNGGLLGSRLKDVFKAMFTGFLGQDATSLIYALLDESGNFKYTLPTTKADIEQNASGYYPVYKWPETTSDRVDRNDQRDLIIAYLRMMLLMLAYSMLGTGKFDTEDQLDKIKTDIEKEYIDLMHGITGIEDGARLQQSTGSVASLVTDKDVWTDFQKLRIAALIACENDRVVTYKVDYGKIRDYHGVSVLNAAYLSSAESIKTESDLLDMARIMYNINGREPYHLKGDIKILKRLQ